MIDFSGRATRAGTRGIAAAAAVSCFTIMPLLASHESAHADGPGGSSGRAHDHRPTGRDHDVRPGGREQAPAGSEHGLAGWDRGPAAWGYGDRSAWPGGDHETTDRDHRDGHVPPRSRVILDTQGPRGAVVPGRTYTWPYSVTNTGAAPVRNVTLTTRPNRDLKIVAMPPKCRWRGGRDLVCQIGVLPARQTRHGALTATVDPKTPTGRTLAGPAKVSWAGRPGSTTREMAFPPVTASQPTDLAVSGDVLPETVRPGGEVPYEISVTNEGPVTAEAVVVRSSVANDPDAWPAANDPGTRPLTKDTGTSPCGTTADPARPLAGQNTPRGPADPPCAAPLDRPATSAGQAPAVPPCAAAQAQPAAPRCGAEGRQPACGACAVRQPAAGGVAADRPEVRHPAAEVPAAGSACGACAGQQGAPACGACAVRHPAAEAPAAGQACGACAGQQSVPACGACAGHQGVPACGSALNGPAGNVADRPVGAPCASSPARVAAEPGKAAASGVDSGIHRGGSAEAPIGPGIGPERPAPNEDTPIVIGKDRHCLTQGPGFVCPLGAIPPGRTRKLRLAVRARPHAHPGRLRCLSTVASGTPDENPANNSVACHTRNARPMPVRPAPGVHRLPHTGFPYATVALSGMGLAAVGLLLVWIGRARRGEEV
ncbi:hypothetical protein GCM10023195_49590 [Actinoallomurus liliacearum]|uniref:DUF11 domain-containing protein n=1 Tax=Actinoallomurus liliacearum TaxID=1080073 RepID=A0ABP8TPU5_9ACTN